VHQKLANILLVEDNPGDVRLTREAFKKFEGSCAIHVVQDGEQALEYLRQEGDYTDAVRPNLVLLDLNLPKIDGKQVLRELKADPKLRSIPVVIFSSSRRREDVFSTYDDHANCYITKPYDFDEFEETIKRVADFWLNQVALPDPLLTWASAW